MRKTIVTRLLKTAACLGSIAWNLSLSAHAQGVNSTAFWQRVAGGSTAAATGKAISLDISGSENAHGKVVFDAAGNFYFSDRGNDQVIKVDLAGNFTIVATGAHFYDLAIDSTNNILYAAGYGSQTIIRVDLNTNTQATPFNTGDTTVAVGLSPDGTKLYYTLRNQCSSYRLDLPSTTPTRIAGIGNCGGPSMTNGGSATSGRFHIDAKGIIADNNGNVYIADSDDNRIWRINAGIATVVAGNGVAGNAGDGGPATAANLNFPGYMVLDPNGDLIFEDRINTTIRKVALGTGILTTLAGGFGPSSSATSPDGEPFATTQFGPPTGLGIDAAGYYYVINYGVIHRFAPLPITIGKTVANAPVEGVSGSFGIGISCNDGSTNPGTLTLSNQATNSQLLQYMPPLGATCTVVESTPLPPAPAYHEWTGAPSYSLDGGTPTAQLNNLLIDNTGHSVMVTNNLLRQTSTLNVTKLITPSEVAAVGDFGFTVSCQTPAGSYAGTVAVTAGNTGTTSISVPVGSTNCQVSETSQATPPQGYQWEEPVYQQPPAAPLQDGVTVSASIANTLRSNSSPTAAPVPLLSLPGLLALGVLMAGAAGWSRRRNFQ